jgi:hypothetical protein
MCQIWKKLSENDMQVVLPRTVDPIYFSRISQYLPFPALSRLSRQLGGLYSKTNLGIIGHGMAKVILRLLSDPYLLQATTNSCGAFSDGHHLLDCRFPQLLIEQHAILFQTPIGLADYSWHVSECLVNHELRSYRDLDEPRCRGCIIWERYSWDYVPLLRAATVLSKYPCLLLWFDCQRSTPAICLNQSTNNGSLLMAMQEMDMVAIEMKMAGVVSTYFLQLYLDYVGKYALEIFTAVHIKPVQHFWWKRVGALNSLSQPRPPDCSCSPVAVWNEPEEEDYDYIEYSEMKKENETLETAD